LLFPRGGVYAAALTPALSTQGARRFISARCVRQAAGAQDITVCCMQREPARRRRAARRRWRSRSPASAAGMQHPVMLNAALPHLPRPPARARAGSMPAPPCYSARGTHGARSATAQPRRGACA